MRQPEQKRYRVALVALALILAQTAALSHFAVDDIHSNGESCDFCVALASYAGGNVASAHTVDVSCNRQPLFDFLNDCRHAHRSDHRLARGPPPAS